MNLYQIPRASLSTQGSSPTIVDVKSNGASILGGNKLQVDTGSRTSKTSALPTSLITTVLNDDDEITLDITAGGTIAKGLKVTIYYQRI